MGRHSVAGIRDIKRQCWIPALSHSAIMRYNWNAYPPIRHDIRSEVVYMDKGSDGRPSETCDQAAARHMAGTAADRRNPLGFEAQGGHHPEADNGKAQPSYYSGYGYYLGFGTAWTRDLAGRCWNGAYCHSVESREHLLTLKTRSFDFLRLSASVKGIQSTTWSDSEVY